MATTSRSRSLLLLFISILSLSIFFIFAESRPIGADDSSLISDGIDTGSTVAPRRWWNLRFPRAEPEACKQSYGFLPCTKTGLGNLFLILVYGFLMFKAATYLSSGSELLLEILGPGIVGGLFLPILGALPDALLILVSGLSGTKEEAQSQVLVGMGLLAGSTVFLLTVLWGSCVVVGKCDFSENLTAIDQQDTKKFSLSGSGVSTDFWTSYAARIMALSIIPFIIVQFPKILNSHSADRVAVLIAFVAAVIAILSYCFYQVYQPWIQKRKIAFAKHKHVISGILRHAQMVGLGRLFTSDGEPNIPVIKSRLYQRLDLDSDGYVSESELRGLIVGIEFENIDDLDVDDAVNKIVAEFDHSQNNVIDEEEFVNGLMKWLKEAKGSVGNSGAFSKKFVNEYHHKTKQEHDMLLDKSDEAVQTVDNPTWVCVKAVLLLLLGAIIAAAFADPLVDAVDNFSVASKIPSFFVSFIVLPFATNSSEAVSAIIFASRKKQRTASLTFSEIYGGVTMNNTLCLAVFLAIVYARGLTWDFSSEVLIIFLVCVIMGLFASFRTTFPLWACFIAYLLYPLSLVVVYILDYWFGWS